jgi:hypothetical protein
VGLNSWYRAFPPSEPLDVEAGLRFTKRENRLKDKLFISACELAGIPATPRQARKWNNGTGKAFGFRNTARAYL